MSNKEFVLVSAANARYFPMLMGLLLSIRRQAPERSPDVAILDVGLTPGQRTIIESEVTRVVTPTWDVAHGETASYPSSFRAMTARPHLPDYFPGYDVYVAIDGDAWVQSWTSIELMVETAKTGALAIVEERYGSTVSFEVESENGPEKVVCRPEDVKYNVNLCYERNFGPHIAAWLGEVPSYNAGVFALGADSSAWHIWHNYLGQGLARGGYHHLVDQLALNLAIRRGEIPVVDLPITANFVCTHALPAFDPKRSRFVVPWNGVEIGILHLADLKRTRVVEIQQYPDTDVVGIPLHYLDFLFSTAMNGQ